MINVSKQKEYGDKVRLKYSARIKNPIFEGYVLVEEYYEFFVITKGAYRRAYNRLGKRKPHFDTNKKVHILGKDIS